MLRNNKKISDYTALDVCSIIIQIIVIHMIVSVIFNALAPIDSTDDGRFARSGVRIVTDHATGIQYLETSQGFLTPRLGKK